jgi:hypothetical protein
MFAGIAIESRRVTTDPAVASDAKYLVRECAVAARAAFAGDIVGALEGGAGDDAGSWVGGATL